MRHFDRELQDRWVEVLDAHGAELSPRAGLRLLAQVAADPVLSSATIEDTDDVQDAASALVRRMEALQLEQFGVENPADATEAYTRAVVETFLERLEASSVSAEAILTDAMLESSGEGDEVGATQRSRPAGAGQHDSPGSEPSSSQHIAATPPTASKKPDDDGAMSALDGAEVAASETSDGMESAASETETDSPDDATTSSQEDLNFDIIDFEGLLDSFESQPQTARLLSTRLGVGDDDPDLQWLRDNPDQLYALLTEGSPADRTVAAVGFTRLVVDDYTSVTPYLDGIESLFRSNIKAAPRLALLIYRGVAVEEPEALVGHLSPLWSLFSADDDRNLALLYDVAERVARASPEHVDDQVSIVAGGLNDPQEFVRYNAALTLLHVGDRSPETLEPYVGALVDQLDYDDRSGRTAAIALAMLSDERPSSIKPYLTRVVEAGTGADEELLRAGSLYTIRRLLAAEVVTRVNPEPVVANLEHDSEMVVQQALLTSATLVVVQPEPVVARLEEFKSFLAADTVEIQEAAALVFSGVPDSQPSALAGHLGDVLDQLGTTTTLDRRLMMMLRQLAEDNHDLVVPHLELLTPRLTADDQTLQRYAAEACGYVAQEQPASLEDHLPAIDAALADAEASDVVAPLLDVMRCVGDVAPEAVPVATDRLVGYATEAAPQSRTFALRALGNLYPAREEAVRAALDDLLPGLMGDDPQVRMATFAMVTTLLDEGLPDVEAELDWLFDRVRTGPEGVTGAMAWTVTELARVAPELAAELPIEPYLETEETELRAATYERVRRLAAADQVDVTEFTEHIVAGLDADSESVRATAARATVQLAADAPATVAEQVDTLVERLQDSDAETRGAAMDAIERVVREQPGAVEPHAETIAQLLEDDVSAVVRDAAATLGHLVDRTPDVVEAHLDTMQDLLTRDDVARQQGAVVAFSRISTAHPEWVARATELLVETLDGHEQIATYSLLVLAKLTDTHADRIAPHIEQIRPFLDDEDATRRGLALTVLCKVSSVDPGALTDDVDIIVRIGEDEELDVAVADALGNIVKTAPDAVADHVPTLRDLTGSDDQQTSALALVALGRLAASHPEAVVDDLDTYVDYLGADVDYRGQQLGAAMVAGNLSKHQPAPVATHIETLVEFVEGCSEAAAEAEGTAERPELLPAVDAIRNVADHDRTVVTPYADRLSDIAVASEQTQRVLDTVLTLCDEETTVGAEAPATERAYASLGTVSPSYGVDDDLELLEQLAAEDAPGTPKTQAEGDESPPVQPQG